MIGCRTDDLESQMVSFKLCKIVFELRMDLRETCPDSFGRNTRGWESRAYRF